MRPMTGICENSFLRASFEPMVPADAVMARGTQGTDAHLPSSSNRTVKGDAGEEKKKL